MIYSRRDFKVAHSEQFPEMMALTLAVGVWDNFTVAKGMDVYAWTSRPVAIARWAVRSVVKVLEKDGDLFAYDYSFRSLYHTRWESRHFAHFTINGAAVWILPGPGQLFLGHTEDASFGPVKVCDVDLRPFERYEMADGTEIRIRRKKADFGLPLHMKKLLDFLESCPEDTVEIRHHYEGAEA